MLDSIHIGTSGLDAFSAQLKVISNNVANLNTPGFKSSQLAFEALVAPGGLGPDAQPGQLAGGGVIAGQTFVNYQAGETRETGNPLDMSINGEGFFVVQSPSEKHPSYTRNGQFEFSRNGSLVVRGSDREVLGLGSNGAQQPITLNGLRISAPQPTKLVKFSGNISSGSSNVSVDNIKVIDALGAAHNLKMVLKPKGSSPGTWSVSILDGLSEISSKEINYVAGRPVAGQESFTVSYGPGGATATDIKFDFSGDVTSFDTGQTSSLSIGSVDGRLVGAISKIEFDAEGRLSVSYSNGDSVKGPRVALARFDDSSVLKASSHNDFIDTTGSQACIGGPKDSDFGSIESSRIEGSNVELAREFSDLIVAQRGYQASSRIVSTANDMLQDLLEMKGHR